MWNVGGRFMRSFQYILFLCIGLFLLSSCGNKNTEDQIGATQGSDHDGVVTQDQDSDFESFDFKDKISTISAAPSDSLKIVADSSNHLYAIGVINMGEGGASTSHGMIWKSMDEGKNWDIFQDFFPVGTRFNQLSDILLVDDQTLYVVGNIDKDKNLLKFLDLSRYFEPINCDNKKDEEKNNSQTLMLTQ